MLPHMDGRREAGVISATLVAWFYFATVDYVTVWAFGPFATQGDCLRARDNTVPNHVEATMCTLMVVEEEES